ncbi:MAG: hypothetical protein IJF14_04470 [Clostridia bacterium]|nr:hypothetical protein [Clostridia bacterium]
MKKKLIRMLSFVLCVCMLFSFAACGEDAPAKDDDITPPANDTPTTDEPEEPSAGEPDTPSQPDTPTEPSEPEQPSEPTEPDEPVEPDTPIETKPELGPDGLPIGVLAPDNRLSKSDPLYSTGWTYMVKRLIFDALCGYAGDDNGTSLVTLSSSENKPVSFSFADINSDKNADIVLRFSTNNGYDYYSIRYGYHNVHIQPFEANNTPIALAWYDYNIETIHSLFVHPLTADTPVGDLVTIGTFEQDADTSNGEEMLVWRVIANDNGKLFLLSEFALETRPLNDDFDNPFTWETCSLREYLNGEFLNSNFTDAEKQIIMTVTNQTADCPGSTWEDSEPFIEGGNDTEDKIFLLSTEEYDKYLYHLLDNVIDKLNAACAYTSYAKETGLKTPSIGGGYNPFWCRWLLRSPGSTDFRKSHVDLRGSYTEYGIITWTTSYAIRPAMWVDATN